MPDRGARMMETEAPVMRRAKETRTPTVAASKRPAPPPVNDGCSGKHFFAIVKDRLCPREFGDFLENMKKCQEKTISKKEALEHARALFGDLNEDLYLTFAKLLMG
jgi:hypothetical protein